AARHGLLQHRVVQLAQAFAEAPVSLDPLRLVGMRVEPRIDRRLLLGIDAAVGIGVQLALGGLSRFAHFTTFRRVAPWPSIMARSFSRARESRDITVPIGMSSVRATLS